MDNNLENQKRARTLATVRDALIFLLLEIVASILIIIGFALFDKYEDGVTWGAIIGSVATVVNYLVMSLSINSAIDKFLALRPEGEMDDEAIERFAAEHSTKIQATVRLSYTIRMACMIGALILALVSGWFNPLSTVIPLLLFKPILYLIELLGRKGGDK